MMPIWQLFLHFQLKSTFRVLLRVVPCSLYTLDLPRSTYIRSISSYTGLRAMECESETGTLDSILQWIDFILQLFSDGSSVISSFSSFSQPSISSWKGMLTIDSPCSCLWKILDHFISSLSYFLLQTQWAAVLGRVNSISREFSYLNLYSLPSCIMMQELVVCELPSFVTLILTLNSFSMILSWLIGFLQICLMVGVEISSSSQLNSWQNLHFTTQCFEV